MTSTLGMLVLGGLPGPILQHHDLPVVEPRPSPHPADAIALLPSGTEQPYPEGLQAGERGESACMWLRGELRGRLTDSRVLLVAARHVGRAVRSAIATLVSLAGGRGHAHEHREGPQHHSRSRQQQQCHTYMQATQRTNIYRKMY